MRLPGLFRCGRAGLLSGRSDALRFEDGSGAPSCRSSDSGMLDRSASPLLLAMFLVLSHPGRSAFSQEVPAGRDSIDAAFAGKLQNNDAADEPSPDTLRLRSLEIEIEQARIQESETNFLHRLLPQIHFSASFGLRNLVFIDPAGGALSVLPKDAYRLNLSVSVNDLFDFSRHRVAELRLRGMQLEYERIRHQQAASRVSLMREYEALESVCDLLTEELTMKEEVGNFNDLRFQQGKIEYDALIRSKLDVLHVKQSIDHLHRQMNEVRFRLHDENPQ